MPSQDSKQDRNQFPGLLVVQGTAGTADVDPGTSILMRASGNPSTGAVYVEDLGAGAGGTQAVSGTIVVSNVEKGTITRLEGGSMVFTGGTLSTGTLQNLVSGTVTQTVPTAFNGGTVAVGTSAVELTFTGVTQSIMVTADHNNGTMIYIGGSDVVQSGSNAVARLDPGEAVTMDLNDASAAVYAVAGTTAQKVYKFALT